MLNPPLRLIGLIAIAGWIAGCATVGPSFRPPAAPAARGYTRTALPAATASAPGPLGRAQAFVTVPRVERDWWHTFGSAKLDALIGRAQRDSPTLAAAVATLREARQLVAAQAGSTRYPTIDAKLGANREEVNGASIGQPRIPQSTFTLFNAAIGVSYDFDAFGGTRRALEALAAQADYRACLLAGARLTLAANVATTAFAEAQVRAEIEATRAILAAERRQLDIARRGERLGTASRADVLALQTEVEQTRASVPPLRNRLEQAAHLLAVLAGRPPGTDDVPRFALSDFRMPVRLPMVVPSDVVRERPDVQAATALLHAATAQYGVAVSNLYPHLNLSASLGTAALTTSALFGPGSAIWSLAGGLAQPLFNAGLRAGASAAEASMQAVGATYRQTVLQALRDVADALRQVDNDARVLRREAAAYASARQTLDLVHRQTLIGTASTLQWLDADRQLEQIRLSLIAARAAKLADSAALYQAMGGGVFPGGLAASAPRAATPGTR